MNLSARCRYLSETLDSTIVLQGSASDRDLLVEENINDADIFLALTNDDEANIMSSLLAKRLGARKVMTIINNPAYVDLVQGGEIDIAISPAQATVGPLLSNIRRGDMVAVHSLRRGAAEVLEVVVHGDFKTSKVVGRRIGDVALPEGATIAAIIRNHDVIIAHHDTLIEAEDHLILFALNKRIIWAVRSALGATRWQVLRPLLVEGLVLALMAGGLGLLISQVGVRAAVAAIPVEIPYWITFELDGRVLAFALGVSALSCVLFALAPAWHAVGRDCREDLKSAGRGAKRDTSR